MYFLKPVQPVFAAILLTTVLAFSASAGNGDGNSQGQNQQGGGGKTLGAPGPVAGVGLTSLALAGGYLWFARRARQSRVKKQPK